MNKYNIIFFNMSKYSDWTKSGVVNRNFHLVHNLAKDERVEKIICVDFLPFTWKRAVKYFLKEQLKNDNRGEVIYGDLADRVWQVSPKIHVFSSLFGYWRRKRLYQELRKVISKLGMSDNLIVYNFNPLIDDYFGQLKQKINIFDFVDNWAEHSSYKLLRTKILRNYKSLVFKSDLVYSVSQEMTDNFGEKVKWLPNAVDYDHFQTLATHHKINNFKKPILGFLGIMQDRIDVELIKQLSRANPDKSIVLCGPVWKGFPKSELEKLGNVFFIGPVAYIDIPKAYHSFDVGLILYKNNEFIKSTNSMKYYEYLASGLPVVSTYSGGVEKFGEVIYIAKNNDEFVKLADRAINENSDLLREKRKDFVKNMSWKNRINTILLDIEGINPRNP